MEIKLIDFGLKNMPCRKHIGDAGADVYVEENICIPACTTVKIPLGFGLEIPDNLVGFIAPRSSVAAAGLTAELVPIDSGYCGEIHAIVTNNTAEDIQVVAGQRIAQLLIVPCILATFVKILPEEATATDRGTTCFGASGR